MTRGGVGACRRSRTVPGPFVSRFLAVPGPTVSSRGGAKTNSRAQQYGRRGDGIVAGSGAGRRGVPQPRPRDGEIHRRREIDREMDGEKQVLTERHTDREIEGEAERQRQIIYRWRDKRKVDVKMDGETERQIEGHTERQVE